MAPQYNSSGRSSRPTGGTQSERDPAKQSQSETNLSSGVVPSPPREADHPNRDWRVIQPDSSYTPHQGPWKGRIITPGIVGAVLAANDDHLDEEVAKKSEVVVANQTSDAHTGRGRSREEIGHRRTAGHQTAVPHHTRSATTSNVSQNSHGESSARKNFNPQRETGISLDGFPSRSVEEGGVGGLFHHDRDEFNDSAASAAASTSTSLRSSGPSTDEVVYTAQAVTICPARAGQRRREEVDMSLLPSLAAIDRMDRLINETIGVWEDAPVAEREGQPDFPTVEEVDKQVNERGDRLLTGIRERTITAPNRVPIAPYTRVAEGDAQTNPSSDLGTHHTQETPHPYGSRTDAYPKDGEQAKRRPPSPTPSESSIAETIFHVRRPTPPPSETRAAPWQSSRASLPSQLSRERAAGGSDGLQRGGMGPATALRDQPPSITDADLDARREDVPVRLPEDVPSVLVPGGWMGLGGSVSTAQASRRQDRGVADGKQAGRGG
ncbi:hypothetical protein J7T55_002093 [Diaporthe amygdali]|uniref:uncharacterized protein n=1 Tax=Phomopsis amygdali TaxID=1214568 RepID=UPI0022FE5F90|nr:uncharacterized protein J7T55_002093 [Diaporthe amygdali]KAJ0108489.1 hypothetical protein J7T55_002093 [Diaporthe amygdali]